MPLKPKTRNRPWRNKNDNKAQSGRKADSSFYHTSSWRRLSKSFREDNPLCEECKQKGRIVPSSVADHIVRIEDGGNPLDRDNLQALCHRCHNRKSGKERHANKS